MVGGGRIAHYLTSILSNMGVAVKLVERKDDRCRVLAEAFPRSLVICGDGTDQEMLESEHFTSTDAFVALTDRDEDNLIISLYALQRGISKAIAKCNRQNYAGIAHSAGLDSVISPKLITASYILQLVRGMRSSKGSVMKALYQIADGKAEAMEFTVLPGTRGLGTPIHRLDLKKGVLIAAIIHNGKVTIPEGSSSITKGDTVIIVSRDQSILELNDIFASPPDGPVAGA
ncbi:Trk system potassium uptake protein TrkA [bioreactor metagenome]|uniref:Trk system potassium uptake protein TrkA n=1 Tax=bioreactor metagenome TaxID=1076179 RepID=A0A645DGS6_9ZZZZ